MKGLILKDLITLKKAFKSYGLLFIGYLAIDMMSEQSSLTLAVAFIIATMLPIATISYDERCKWDKIANTMPVSRREIVYSKYLLGLGLTTAALAVTFLFNKMPLADRVASVSAIGLMCLVYQAILIPVLIKFGSEVGRVIMMLVLLVPFVALGALTKLVDFESMNIGPFLDKNIAVVAVVALAAAVAIYALSVVLSVKIYSRKEF